MLAIIKYIKTKNIIVIITILLRSCQTAAAPNVLHDIAAEREEEARLLGTTSFVWSSGIINTLSRSEFILLK